jgi:hypothetical protein
MLDAEQVEQAFIDTAREQRNGEPFNWRRLARHLNEQLADAKEKELGARPLLLAESR